MSRDGSGNYSLPSGNPVVPNTIISSGGWANPTLTDIAAALTQSLSKDGQTVPTANLPMGNFRHLNVANAQSRTDYAAAGQVQDNAFNVLSGIGGTGDAITASTTPPIAAYATGAKWIYTPTATNTVSNPTLNLNGLGAKTVVRSDGGGLWSGALVVGTAYELMYDGTNLRVLSGQLGNVNGQSAVVPPGTPTALRNRVIDGNFDLWTAGTSFPLTVGQVSYGPDMWVFGPGTGGSAACTLSQNAFSAGGEPTGVTSPSTNAFKFQQTAAASVQAPFFAHRIENVATFDGRSCTISVWLWVASGTLTLTNPVQVSQVFGGGGSASVITTPSVSWNLTTTPQRFSIRVDVPSISGKTIGTNHYLQAGLVFPLSSTFTILGTQFQAEDCPAGAPAAGMPTPFEMVPVAMSKAIAERYYMQRNLSARFNAGTGAMIFDVAVPFTQMRLAPATALITAGSRTNISGSPLLSATVNGARFEIVSAASGDTFALNDIWALDARF